MLGKSIKELSSIETKIVDDLKKYDPVCILRVGSFARVKESLERNKPNDLDLIYIGIENIKSIQKKDYGFKKDIWCFKPRKVKKMAHRMVRHRPWVSGLIIGTRIKIARHVREKILACALIGPDYYLFGLDQEERGFRPDPRDYSVHQALFGRKWWDSLRRPITRRVAELKEEIKRKKPSEPGY
ncbi:hypothetical protein HQ545_07775 [Candidatus Woesearchaeota archaeon]|nr:hypothetical protein [Candidatus Woesearchaeota archaeon]